MNTKVRTLLVSLFSLMLVLAVHSAALADFSYSRITVNGVDYSDTGTQSNPAGEGTITWDPASATLTLENATFTAEKNIEVVFRNDASDTLTVILKGANSIESPNTSIYTNGHFKIVGEQGASLMLTSTDANAFYTLGSLTIDGGTYTLSSGYPPVCAEQNISISGGAKIKATTLNNSAIYTNAGDIQITGAGTEVNVVSHFCGLITKAGDISITDGASLTAHTKNDHPVYAGAGSITLDNATITLTSDYESATALFSGSVTEPLSIRNSSVYAETNSTSLFSRGDIEIVDSVVSIASGANPMYAKKALHITGTGTKVTTQGAYPIQSDDVVTIDGGATLSPSSTKGTALSGEKGIIIAGGANVTVDTEAQMAALYSAEGDIRLEGLDTKVKATSKNDSAIFTRNGKIVLNAGEITATSAEGFAPFTARKSGQTDITDKPENLIIIGENFNPGNNVVASTVWKQDSAGTYYSDTIFVPAGTQLTQDGLLPEDYQPDNNEIIVVVKPADYTAVDAAIAKAESLDKEAYDSFAAVEAAIAAVVRGKNITQQAEVDAMAKAIEDAIAALKESFTPRIIAGANSTWQKGSSEGLSVTSNAAYADFLKVQVDGKDLGTAHYTVKEGSTIVTLKPEYLATLSVGKHMLAIVSSSGTAATDFVIANAASVPQTGDSSQIGLWMALMVVSALGIFGAMASSRKKKYSK